MSTAVKMTHYRVSTSRLQLGDVIVQSTGEGDLVDRKVQLLGVQEDVIKYRKTAISVTYFYCQDTRLKQNVRFTVTHGHKSWRVIRDA